MKKVLMLLVLPFTLLAAPAFAHTGDHGGGFFSGLVHPFTGVDHLIVMALLGCWFAALSQKVAIKSTLAVVVAFAASIVAGSVLTSAAISYAEWAILGSALVMVLLLFKPVQLTALAPLLAVSVVTGHGIAHGVEAAPQLWGFTAGACISVVVIIAASYGCAKRIRAAKAISSAQ